MWTSSQGCGMASSSPEWVSKREHGYDVFDALTAEDTHLHLHGVLLSPWLTPVRCGRSLHKGMSKDQWELSQEDCYHNHKSETWKRMILEPNSKWSEVAQSCPTLCNPVDCGPPGFFVHGILQARILEWVAITDLGSNLRSLTVWS